MNKAKLALLVTAFVGFSPLASAAKWNAPIANVTMGMSIDDAKAAAMKANPKLAIKMHNSPGTTTVDSFWADASDNVGGNKEDTVVVRFVNGRAWSASRIMVFPKGSRPTMSVLLGAIEEKYGSPNDFFDVKQKTQYEKGKAGAPFEGMAAFGWTFDRSGNHVAGKTACGRIDDQAGASAGTPQGAITENCGVRSYATAMTEGSQSPLVTSFVMYVADVSMFVDAANAEKNGAAKAKQDATNAEISKGNKPKL